MKAKFQVGDVIVALPVEYLDQQTCEDSKFSGVPAGMVDILALIMANRSNREVMWYREGANNDYLHISVPTDLITWED